MPKKIISIEEIPNLMLKYMDLLIQDKKYIEDGFNIQFDMNNFELIITYKNKEYIVKLTRIDNQLYWHLVPYNNSVFNTAIENGLNVVLFAIKENEELYS